MAAPVEAAAHLAEYLELHVHGYHDAQNRWLRDDARNPQGAQFRNLPILALTAKAIKGDREKCLDAGSSDNIAKPVNTDQLLSLSRKCGFAAFLDPHGGRPASAGLGALSRKCGFATFLDPRGGRPASAGLGALMSVWLFC